MDNQKQLSRSGAAVMGTLFIVVGCVPILIGVGAVTPTPDGAPPPAWVLIAAGLLFVFGGAAVILDYAIGHGVGPDGDLAPGTPFYIRVGNYVLGLGIVGLMASVFGWVAFGPGPRSFSTTTVIPFAMWHSEHGGELSGRIAFGIVTVLLALMFVACGVAGVRKLGREWRAAYDRSHD